MNYKKLLIFTILFFQFLPSFLKAQGNCVSGCNDNAYTRSSDPNTIEYDAMVSVFHSTIVKESDGTVKIWGQGSASNGSSHIAPPQIINATNYPGLTGDVLKFTAGSIGTSHQFAVLTTKGLFVWGIQGTLIDSKLTSSNNFSSVAIGTAGVSGTKADGLPVGVSPTDVKMLFGSYGTLAIVTCSGEAWVLSFKGDKNGDGTSQNSANNIVWHRVRKSSTATDYLTDVVALRGTTWAMIALTSDGKIYTWGNRTYLGDGSPRQNQRTYATEMAVPDGITPKMIGMTINNNDNDNKDTDDNDITYYLLGTNGNLYALGENGKRQIGDFTTTNRTSWTRPLKSSSSTDYITNIAWISPQEHDNKYPAINVLTADGKLYAWGENNGNMFGMPSTGTYNPTYMPGSIASTEAYDETKLNHTDVLMAVETGGHTTIAVKQCSNKFGYVGHKINGSMGNNTSDSGFENQYNFGDTANLNICGAATVPAVPTEIKICPSTVYNLSDAHQGTIPSGFSLVWYTTATRDSGTEISAPVGPGTYYAFYIPASGPCTSPSYVQVIVSYYSTSEASANNCYCTKPGSTQTGGSPTKVGITNQTKLSTWPEAVPNGHITLESKTNGFVITRVANSGVITEPKKGMLIYDIAASCVKLYNGTAWKCIQRGCNE